jgi:hypothetical protein
MTNITEIREIRDKEKCDKCGGKCCRIYRVIFEGDSPLDYDWFWLWYNDWEREYKESWAASIPPLFDPILVHTPGNEHMIEELTAKGIDHLSCRYRGPRGCLIPRQGMPRRCREYMCDNPPSDPPPPLDTSLGGIAKIP